MRFRLFRHVGFTLVCTGLGVAALATPISAQRLPKDLGEYIAEADKLCAASNVKLLAESKKIETEKARSTRGGRLKKVDIAMPDGVASFTGTIAVPELTRLSTNLRAIPSPRGDEKLIDTLLDEFDSGIAVLKKDPKAAIFTDPLKASSKAFKAVRFGDKVRFTACGIHIDRAEDAKK